MIQKSTDISVLFVLTTKFFLINSVIKTKMISERVD